ncbi:MAG: FAD-binding oxidoreductase [Tabrizicola sp.]|uniref:NAD(P)/FAD-dependent oxidoreductase n=1 Tax=Tabrizicola sp. TaxID=2005166 RepID=UPI002ABA913F|nr:FAD-binding oxidoreductase [Tabrizicola sp.]MDZ4087611.1 FAD-binding oxidoreductase [Tabrizicola sp.]
MTSETLWRTTARETFTAPPLAADRTIDLAIIGGGFTGCAAALEAARQGASVCLLEAQTIGHGGSGRNVGLVNAGLWLPPDTVRAQTGEAAGTKLLATLAEAPSRVFALIDRESIDCEPTRNGTLHLAHAAKGLADLTDRHSQGRAMGAPLDLLDATETTRRTGSTAFHGALFDPRAGTIQPLSYVRGLARAATQAGAHLHEKSPVQSITRQADLWHITSGPHTLRARRLLVATNAYHLALGPAFRPAFVPVHYCQYATDPLPPARRDSILPQGEGCWDTALVMSSVRRDRAGRIIIGGIGNGTGPGSRVHAAWARRKLAALYPALKDIPLTHGWTGRIAMTRDHIPKIIAFGPDAYAIFGYSGRGIGPGTVFGTQAAQALLSDSETPLPLAPIKQHKETAPAAQAAYFETGACLTHALTAR